MTYPWLGIGCGVVWFLSDHYGFWLTFWYGLTWPFWVGYHLAKWIGP